MPSVVGSFRFFISSASQRCADSSLRTTAAKVWSRRDSGRH
jgi:hypothetical protein